MKPHSFFATLAGIGFIPFASGTWASAVALPFAWIILADGGMRALGVAATLAIAIGIWACDVYVRESGKDDPSECVIDELAGQWIACMTAPLTPLGFGLAFVLFRVFDIVKPWPISAAERAPRGLGVMLDDIVAGIFAALIVAGLHGFKLI